MRQIEIFLFAILLSTTSGFAQIIADFETIIYFEDAIGNKDSIIVGHDLEANVMYNPDFGELDINEPFDSIFEVRAAHYLDWATHVVDEEFVLSKKIIGSQEDWGIHPIYNCRQGGEAILFFIHAKYQPVTISWDKNVFDESWCLHGTLMAAHVYPLLSQYWWEFEELLEASACMAADSILITEIGDIFYGDSFIQYPIGSENNIDTIWSAIYIPKREGLIEVEPCPRFTTSNQEITVGNVSIYPNPTNGIINILSDAFEIKSIEIFNQSGLSIETGNHHSYDITDFSSGIYFVKYEINGRLFVEKIVKL